MSIDLVPPKMLKTIVMKQADTTTSSSGAILSRVKRNHVNGENPPKALFPSDIKPIICSFWENGPASIQIP